MSIIQQLVTTTIQLADPDTNPTSSQGGVPGFLETTKNVIVNIFHDGWRLGTCALFIVGFCAFVKKAMSPGPLKVTIGFIGSFVIFWLTYKIFNLVFQNPYPMIPGEPTLAQVIADLSSPASIGFWVMVVSFVVGLIVAVIVKGMVKGILIGAFTGFSILALYSFIVAPLVMSIYNAVRAG